ncbi:hypothetical protein ACNAST_22600, partial [Klebsiella pneumoniae]
MATPDWEAIESAYRAGVLSLRDIGDKYGVTEGAIRKRAKEGANKQVISSQADSLIKISRIWADFFPANTSNQPI